MLCGAAIRCWRCTISVIVNHAHRFRDPSHEAQLTKTLDDGGDGSLRLPGRPPVPSSTSSSSSLSTQSSYFLVTGGDDVAKLQLENEGHSGDEDDLSESDGIQRQRPQRQVLTDDTAATKQSVATTRSSPGDRRLVSVKVSRTVRAAALLYTVRLAPLSSPCISTFVTAVVSWGRVELPPAVQVRHVGRGPGARALHGRAAQRGAASSDQ